jgi:hypothetical protein
MSFPFNYINTTVVYSSQRDLRRVLGCGCGARRSRAASARRRTPGYATLHDKRGDLTRVSRREQGGVPTHALLSERVGAELRGRP